MLSGCIIGTEMPQNISYPQLCSAVCRDEAAFSIVYHTSQAKHRNDNECMSFNTSRNN